MSFNVSGAARGSAACQERAGHFSERALAGQAAEQAVREVYVVILPGVDLESGVRERALAFSRALFQGYASDCSRCPRACSPTGDIGDIEDLGASFRRLRPCVHQVLSGDGSLESASEQRVADLASSRGPLGLRVRSQELRGFSAGGEFIDDGALAAAPRSSESPIRARATLEGLRYFATRTADRLSVSPFEVSDGDSDDSRLPGRRLSMDDLRPSPRDLEEARIDGRRESLALPSWRSADQGEGSSP